MTARLGQRPRKEAEFVPASRRLAAHRSGRTSGKALDWPKVRKALPWA